MAYGLPARGQQDWDDELNNSIEALKATADAALAASSTAVSTAVEAHSLAQSAGDLNAAVADANTSKVNAAASATSAASSASAAQTARTAAEAAQGAAEAAQAGAEAVGTTNDAIIAGRINDSASATAVALSNTFVATVSPLDATYGAVGDGIADDTTALAAAIAAAPALFTTVDLRGRTYKVTDQIAVPAGVKVCNGTFHNTGTGKKTLVPTGDNVTIKDVSLVGRHGAATASAGESGIFAEGASAAAPLRNLHVERVSAELFGQYGVWLKWVDGFKVKDCDLGDLGYCGVLTYSALNGVIHGNRIDNVLAGFSGNGYGIAMSRDETDSLTTDPRSSRIHVTNNIVSNVPWAGIDTHGGSQIVIQGNSVTNCRTAIALGESDNASNVATWAAQDCIVDGNNIDSTVTDGSYPYAINITGVLGAGIGSPGELSTGCRVTNNVIRGHGLEASTIGCSIIARDTKGLVVSGNTIIEPGRTGILFYYDNYGYTCVGNTTIDPWSNTVGVGEGVGVDANHNGYNTGVVTGNVTVRGTKSATYVATYAVASYSSTGSASIALSGNFGGVTSVVRGGPQGVAPFDLATTPITTTGLATLGSAYVGSTAQGALTAVSNGSVAEGYQIAARGRIGGYGAGIRFESLYGSTVAPQALITADGTGSWADAANASSRLTFKVANAGSLIESFRILSTGTIQIADGKNLKASATTGTKIGEASTEKWGFYGATPIVRPSGTPAAATDAATTQALVNDLRTKLIALGLIA